MAKVDIEAAYRHVPIDPADWDKLTFRWPDTRLLFDGYMQFGLKNACEIFNRIGKAVVRMMARIGIHCNIDYVDDFLIVCATRSRAWIMFWCLRVQFQRLGFKVNMKPGKSVPPTHVVDFLGITLDSEKMQARLNPIKLQILRDLVLSILARHTVTRRELDRLNGKLNWVCKVVYGGGTFLRRLIDAQWSVQRPSHHIRINASMRPYLEWWRDFLPSFNGQTQLIPSLPVSYNDLATDASSSYGYGAFVMGGFVSLSFTHAAALFPDAPAPSEPIHIHELFAVLVMCRLYPAALSGRHVQIFVDNIVAVAVINKGTARGLNGPRMMEFVREWFWLSAIHNFQLTAQYINTQSNVLADTLSRGDFDAFRTHFDRWKCDDHSLHD
jgi:hypothetical protein